MTFGCGIGIGGPHIPMEIHIPGRDDFNHMGPKTSWEKQQDWEKQALKIINNPNNSKNKNPKKVNK